MPALTPSQSAQLIEDAANLLGEAASLTDGGRGEYIRDGAPDNVFDAVPLALARQGCRRYADNPGSPTAARQARVERACRPYLDSLDYGDPPQLKQPFDGGQCLTDYYIIYAYKPVNTDGSLGAEIQQPSITIPGPITGIQVEGPVGALQLVVVYGEGLKVTLRQSSAPQGDFAEPRIVQTVRLDGQPDDCGNVPPEFTPPKPPALPGPTREPFAIAPNVDIDIEVSVNPDLTFDIDIGTGPITIDPFADPPPSGGGGGGGGDEIPPGFQGEPGAPVDVGGGGAADETDPTRNLVGVLVQTIETPPRANQIFNETETYTKGAYFVYFGGDGGLSLNPEGAITIEDQFFYAPEGANRFRVVPNVGFAVRVIPFYED